TNGPGPCVFGSTRPRPVSAPRKVVVSYGGGNGGRPLPVSPAPGQETVDAVAPAREAQSERGNPKDQKNLVTTDQGVTEVREVVGGAHHPGQGHTDRRQQEARDQRDPSPGLDHHGRGHGDFGERNAKSAEGCHGGWEVGRLGQPVGDEDRTHDDAGEQCDEVTDFGHGWRLRQRKLLVSTSGGRPNRLFRLKLQETTFPVSLDSSSLLAGRLDVLSTKNRYAQIVVRPVAEGVRPCPPGATLPRNHRHRRPPSRWDRTSTENKAHE